MILDIHTHHDPPQPGGVISVSPADFRPAVGQLYSVGIHPWDIPCGVSDDDWEKLEMYALSPQVVAIGECGIDLPKGGPLFRQMQVFRRQVDLSEKTGKPLVVHCVKAHDIIIGMKKEIRPEQPWVVHGFRGKPSVAGMLVDAGIMLSFGDKFNAVTLAGLPEEFLLAETDCSQLSIDEVIDMLSEARGMALHDVIAANSRRFLGLGAD